MERPLRLAVIIASTREGRIGPRIGDWFAEQVRHRPDFEFDVIDLADPPLPSTLASAAPAAVEAYRERLADGDAFVVITPEYNHGYPASLKQAIDLAYGEWHAKPVAFVSYGGRSGGLRAVEQLRQVFAEVHAVTVRDGVSLHDPWPSLAPDGRFAPEDGSADAVELLLDRLLWWGIALRDAREARPYAA